MATKKQQLGTINAPDGETIVAVLIVLLLAVYFLTASFGRGKNYDHLVKACEHNLPRNQQCEIVAVPVSKESTD